LDEVPKPVPTMEWRQAEILMSDPI